MARLAAEGLEGTKGPDRCCVISQASYCPQDGGEGGGGTLIHAFHAQYKASGTFGRSLLLLTVTSAAVGDLRLTGWAHR